jgi:hypothetical protein
MILAISLAGCALSAADLPRPSRDAVVAHTANLVVADHTVSAPSAPSASRSDTIDVATLLQTVVALPQRVETIERLGHAIVIAALLVALIGAINAALLVRLLTTIQRAPAATPVVAATIGASCACGASISPRTKSGRCRACALKERSRRIA